MPDIEVHTLESGRVTLDHSMLAQLTDIGKEVEIPFPFYVIDHPEGVALVDTGQSYELVEDPENYGPHGAPGLVDFVENIDMDENEKAIHRLEDLGYSPSEVDTVIMSHLHMDHAGGISDFPDAEFIVQHDELQYASWPEPVQAGFYQEGDFGVLRTPEFDVSVAHGSVDVFGDGRVETIPTPGHTPGHQSVKIELDDAGTVILGMDVSHTQIGFEQDLATSFDWSTTIGNESRRKLKNVARKEDAEVYINHDSELVERSEPLI
ncbi:N-acyl homoserine lactonase family protein [Natrinema caseinilyticum]|uniref:N-acyl homoserine lactonase family protein n=1 Tax=Natrinema caseinilyticum TaxID=2961570 RepID=UPI0020C2B1B4|nr:N-acyl homoserine lactonase family protein [Natrinema caseinilyticum]